MENLQQTLGQPINELVSVKDWSSLLNPQSSPPASQNNSQPGVISQVMSGTYADTVLQSQLFSQGLVPGSFVSPVAPHDYLFNPNAKSLVDATLLSTHSPNTQLLQAQSAQLGASMTPIVGSVATWMNPHSGPFSKGLAALGAVLTVLPMASELGELGNVGKLGGGAADELPALGNEVNDSLSSEGEIAEIEEEVEKTVQHHIFPQARDLRPQFEEAGIDIDEWAIDLPKWEHDRIHSWEGFRGYFGSGGVWNENWRQFFAEPQFANTPPTPGQIWEQAFKMVVGFQLSEYLPTVRYVSKGWW